ncbi:LuxR C-terminal-related transcriptional regulator [Clostridium sp. CMCC3677]|uniref:response regulator transcription factor n=1 Tax=Clostridium sp. CMCC3677 TaxID=2949963 RepID=UPI0013F126F2|nr:LuxR C-terminal-related transcriptional regulator [Clostridium sp. CMCC3677]NFG61306.1 hypothetical protein [Clostridium botulinum]NFQ09223.1 hypothetical protein [Clostridium botulinum]
MIKSQLNKKDYEKIFEFATQVQNIQINFRSTILMNLSNIFGYNYLTFFLADKNGSLINPIATNINPILTKKYINYYYSTDIFYLVKESNEIFQKNVISITDIMPYKQFENTEYYRDFLCLDNLYYEIAIPLRIGESLLGGIGAFRPKELGNFTSKDILILEKLSGIISNALNNYIKLNKISYEQEFLKDITSKAPIGLAVLNNRYSIIYSNNIAEDFCLDILNDRTCLSPIQYVIDKLFMEGEFKKDDSSSFMYSTIKNYNFKVVSSIVPDAFNGLESLMYIYITKEILNEDKTFDKIISDYNLTNREVEVINLVSKGLSNKEISQKLFISCHTVKTHMENIFKKTQVDNRTSLIYKINNITFLNK